jgi:homoserine O-acetyltransferase/O-succinyltransferase
MKPTSLLSLAASILLVPLMTYQVLAADYPAPKAADWTAKDFRFHTSEALPELRIHYTTIGEPTGEPVLALNS